jgi:hypothetical protein
MIARGRLHALSLGLVAATAVAGCSSGGADTAQSKIVKALQMKTVQGHLAMEGNPFCSVSKVLNQATEVKDASSSGRVIASRDHTLGVVVIKPFAPSCRNFAERKLDKLARGGGKKKHKHHHAKNGKKGGGGGG